MTAKRKSAQASKQLDIKAQEHNDITAQEHNVTKAQSHNDGTLKLVELAIDKGADPETIEKLMDLQDRAHKKKAEEAFKCDFALMQQDMPRIEKKKKVSFGQTKYSYAPLEDIAEQIAETLARYGFSYHFEQQHNGELIKVVCVLSHPLGYERRNEMVSEKLGAKQMNNIQAQAAAVTYMRRYTLTGVLGLATADEDIDARLGDKAQPQTKSGALQKALEQYDESITLAWTKLHEADNIKELYVARDLIKAVPAGTPGRGELIHAYQEKESHFGEVTQ